MRGERYPPLSSACSASGSSPRARGTRGLPIRTAHGRRFIPACAGNAVGCRHSSSLLTVHPRVRGERHRYGSNIACSGGSSPRARGTPGGDPVPLEERRFIPACAGNASATRATLYNASVHPRVRGERAALTLTDGERVGSSPRARGTRSRRNHCLPRRRFIPACAGNARSPT